MNHRNEVCFGEKVTRDKCKEKCPSQLVLDSSKNGKLSSKNGKLTRTGNMSNKWQVHTLPKGQILSLP